MCRLVLLYRSPFVWISSPGVKLAWVGFGSHHALYPLPTSMRLSSSAPFFLRSFRSPVLNFPTGLVPHTLPSHCRRPVLHPLSWRPFRVAGIWPRGPMRSVGWSVYKGNNCCTLTSICTARFSLTLRTSWFDKSPLVHFSSERLLSPARRNQLPAPSSSFDRFFCFLFSSQLDSLLYFFLRAYCTFEESDFSDSCSDSDCRPLRHPMPRNRTRR